MKDIFLKFIYWVLANSARRVISRFDPFVIGITGSVGKSTTKDAIYQVMVDHFGIDEVFKTQGNLNAEIGIPLTILGYKALPNKFLWPFFLVGSVFKSYTYKKYPKYIVLEIGIEHEGDMRYFGTIVQPDIVVITSVAGAHTVNFKNLSSYQQEKLEILNYTKKPKLVLLNGDDSTLSQVKDAVFVAVRNQSADFFVENIKVLLSGTEYRISSLGQKIAIKSKFVGKQLIYGQLFAFAIGNFFKMRPLEVARSLEKITPALGRMNIIEGRDGVWIIDDTYNSNPTSLGGALDALSEIEYSGRKVAIIGNMNELGESEKEQHIAMATYAKGKCDQAIFVGPNADNMAKEFGPGAVAFQNRQELAGKLPILIRPKDLVLIKASQNKNYFEEITKILMKDPSLAPKLLVRQSKFWLKKKS